MISTKQQKTIEDAIAQSLLDGQNQIYDLKEGRANPSEIEERMHKSYNYHMCKIVESLEEK